MKNRLLTVAIVVLPMALFLYLVWHFTTVQKPPGTPAEAAPAVALTNAQSPAPANAAAIISSNFALVHPVPEDPGWAAASRPVPAGLPTAPEFTNFAPATVVENVRYAVRQYGQAFGGNPIGTNPEITAALAGGNPKHLNFLTAEAGLRVNAAGEMVDAWGTALFFHQLSATEMEVHSAGPDRIMWTSDDLVAR